MNNKTMTVYSCGGAGLNLARILSHHTTTENLAPYGIQVPEFVYVDTSDSNLHKPGIDRERVFLFEGIDGSGKVRAENHALIAKSALKILQEYKPSAFNIVLSSAAGGSGAVIAHNLISELKKKDAHVILILVGSTASRIEIENTIKTLKSLDVLANKLSSPIVMHYVENSPQYSRADIDKIAVGAATALISLLSGTHDELDSADLRHWLTHPDLGQEVVSLTITHSVEQYQAAQDVISVATLAPVGATTILEPIPAYQAVGYVSDNWSKGPINLIGDEPMNFVLSSEIVEKASTALNNRLKTVMDIHSSRVQRNSLVSRDDTATDDGLIL